MCVAALFSCSVEAALSPDATGEEARGWQLEQDVQQPSYALVEPTRTALNIDTVVLACEKAGSRNLLQLQLYPLAGDELVPKSPALRYLKVEPRAEIVIGRHLFPAELLFAEDYAVLADAERMFPLMSDALLDAMESGETMILRFHLVSERDRSQAPVDGDAVIDLKAGLGGAAVAAVRRCAGAGSSRNLQADTKVSPIRSFK
jgi:hypothetical protein